MWDIVTFRMAGGERRGGHGVGKEFSGDKPGCRALFVGGARGSWTCKMKCRWSGEALIPAQSSEVERLKGPGQGSATG